MAWRSPQPRAIAGGCGPTCASTTCLRIPCSECAQLVRSTRLQERLGTVAQWKLEDGRFVPVPVSASLSTMRGVRRDGAVLQMGLTKTEIERVWHRLQRLLEMVDDGRVKTF